MQTNIDSHWPTGSVKKMYEPKVETHFPPPFFPFVDEFNRERKEKENGF